MKLVKIIILVFSITIYFISCSKSDKEENIQENSNMGIVSEHGMLYTNGNYIVDEHGAPIQLKGMSLFWSQWSGKFWNADVVHNLAQDWGCTVIRAAMGIENGGYLTNPATEKHKVITVVEAAIKEGIYVIIDWHAHDIHTNEAVTFFTEMAQKYKNVPNVIFEIYNEPDFESWKEVKSYAETVIGAIRSQGATNLIVVGSPKWSQDVDIAANDPITGYENIAYTLHFYAGTHKQELRNKALIAMNKGLALFVTEWGTCDASGNGGLNLAESEIWLNFLNKYLISWANWSLFDKDETASALLPGASTTGPWPDSQLTESGKWVKSKIKPK